MPRFDSTGPLGRGSMTGGGKGYCMVPLTKSNSAQQPTESTYDAPTQKSYDGGSLRRVFSGGGFGRRGRRIIGNR